jgi:hypothetical protein
MPLYNLSARREKKEINDDQLYEIVLHARDETRKLLIEVQELSR